MAINNARRLVKELRQNQSFRKKALATTGPEELSSFLQGEGLLFNQRELIGAMAECMEQLDLNRAIDSLSRNKSFVERSEEMESRGK